MLMMDFMSCKTPKNRFRLKCLMWFENEFG
ncbi:hypothetical protein ES319_D07G045100v1 [Gossypium barbadense]|uniref:Uncharacterized protein n=1 Tax=Gossypium barbadense TaxID=3634 RepID=A0A5J5QMF7_GOSBA|nr:hypothetical protein ES319_D07G045100v1 [Gossypium barbadense]